MYTLSPWAKALKKYLVPQTNYYEHVVDAPLSNSISPTEISTDYPEFNWYLEENAFPENEAWQGS